MRLTIILLVFLSAKAYSYSNPQIRICRNHGALFWSIALEELSGKDVGTCLFGSEGAMIGSQSLIDYIHYDKSSLAIQSYFDSRLKSYSNCPENSVTSLAVDSERQQRDICLFSDNSIIERETLVRGFFAPENTKLSRVLMSY